MMDVYENTRECVLQEKRSFRTRSRGAIEINTEEEEAADTGGGAIRLVIASFGVLCMLQAFLNVGLRLSLNSSDQNLSEERDDLQRLYSSLMTSHENLQKERDELQEMYSVLNMSHQNLSEERDELHKMYSLLNITNQILLEEKEGLQAMYLFLNTSYQNVSEQREDLQNKYSSLEDRYNNLRKEKGELHQLYTLLQTSHRNHSEERDKLLAKWPLLLSAVLNQNVSYFRGSFYYGSRMTRSWEESRRYCQEQGADLIVINSKEEQDFVEIFEGRSWIGLSDKETEGVWKWVDGSPLTISSWMSGEPNDEFGEDCVERRRDNNGKWTFNDLSCTQKRESICEIKL